ncbi:MAG: YncE family protein [Candidatus Parcubacteria bacterium]|nr:YncE family protein [Candidatus Parcubacteria bacterium]
MDIKGKKIWVIYNVIIGIAIIFCIFYGLILNNKSFNFDKAMILDEAAINKTIVNPEELGIVDSTSSETELVDNSQPAIKPSTDNIQQTKKISILIDPVGQLVHHLFNIVSVPSPKATVFTADGKEIWTTLLLNKKRGVSIFDSLTGDKVADINLADGGGVEIIFSLDGNKAYVSQMETAQVFEIDKNSKKVLRVFNTGSAWTKILELSADGKTLFASNWSGNDVSEINLEEGKLIRRIPTIKTPRGLYATKDGNYLYVAGFDKGEIEKIDLKTGKGKVIYKSGGAMRGIAADEEKEVLYISDMGKSAIFQVFLKNDEVKKFVNTDHNPNTIVLSPDKKILFVSCRGINNSSGNYYIPGPEWGSVLLFDTENGTMLDAIIGGNQPTALDVSPDGKLLVFSDFLDSRLEVFEVPSYSVLKDGDGGRSEVYKSELRK